MSGTAAIRIRLRRRQWLVALLVIAGPCWPAHSIAAPRGFFGVVPQAPLSSPDFDRMQGVVGTLRVPLYWFEIEPRPGRYDFSGVDEEVGAAADRGIRVLPFVYGSPVWLTRQPAVPPQGSARGRAAWVRFLRRLAHRYGPRGAFWRGRARRLPIRRWQIWNEPNFLLFWRPRPSPRSYARLLRIAARALHRSDRGASIVTAGLALVRSGMLPWVFLRRLYGVAGAKRSFDVVGLHPYASSLPSLEFQIFEARAAMLSADDGRTPPCDNRARGGVGWRRQPDGQDPGRPGGRRAPCLPPAPAPARALAHRRRGLVQLAGRGGGSPLRLLPARGAVRPRR